MQQSDLIKKLMFSRLRILNDFGFYGLLLMQMKYGLDDSCDTAYTDGKKICFSSKFLAGLSNDEVDFVMTHEVLHVALKHCERGLKYDPELFNIACDIVVNSNILQANNMNPDKISIDGQALMHLTPNNDEGYLYTAEEVYEMLVKKMNKSSNSSVQNSGNQQSPNNGTSSSGGNQQSQNSGASSSGGNQQSSKGGKGKKQPTTFDSHDKWGQLSEEDKQKIDQMVNEAIELTEATKKAGNTPGYLLRKFKELKEPKISWKELINDLLSFEICDYSFSPPDRRFQDDFFLPDFNEYDYQEEQVYCFIDTSGSITEDDLTTLISEINGALIQYGGKVTFKVLFFDTEVYEGIEVKSTEDIHKLMPKGYGGTSFINVFKYINKLEEKPKAVVMFTDGYADFPKKDYTEDFEVIWILTSDDVTPPWGRYARIKI